MNTNTTDELLQAILAELQKQNGTVNNKIKEISMVSSWTMKDKIIENYYKSKQSQGSFIPKYGDDYGYVTDLGEWKVTTCHYDKSENIYRRHVLGNCYPLDQEDRAIWEQVTRRKHDQALRDAADCMVRKHDDGMWVYGEWDSDNDVITTSDWTHLNLALPCFASKDDCIEAHTRILGNDAKRYFTGEV